MATLSDVARLAGVSVSIASRVLTGAPSARARPETRARIRAAAETLGYQPNFAGRALKSARSNVIALVLPDLTNAFFADLVMGVEDAATERDYVVLLGRAEDMRPGGQTIKKLVGEGRVDGILLQPGDEVDPTEYRAESKVPVILINAGERGSFAGSVALDDEAGARTAVKHLVSLGHRRIGMVNGLPSAYTARRREAGFRQALEEAALDISDNHITRLGYANGAGHRSLVELMRASAPPTAVLVSNLNAAIGLVGEARARAVQIPQDLSVVALHDAWTAESTWPPLTTVRMPLYQLGYRAVESLHLALRGQLPGEVLVSDPAPQLVRRESAIAL